MNKGLWLRERALADGTGTQRVMSWGVVSEKCTSKCRKFREQNGGTEWSRM